MTFQAGALGHCGYAKKISFKSIDFGSSMNFFSLDDLENRIKLSILIFLVRFDAIPRSDIANITARIYSEKLELN